MAQETFATTADGKIRKHIYGAVLLILLAIPFVAGDFQQFMVGEVILFAVFATAFNLLYGYNGLLSFGHAMFVAIPGYVFAVFFVDWGPRMGLGNGEIAGGAEPLLMFFIGIVLALLITFLITVPVGWFSVRLEEIYFAIITLSFGMLFYAIVERDMLANYAFPSGGDDGRTVIMDEAQVLGFDISLWDPGTLYFFILLFSIPSMWAMWRIVNSPFGEISKAIRENPQRARAIGVDETKHSWYMFTISGMFSAVAGVMMVPLRTYIAPAHANWTFSAEPVLMTIIGGPTSFLGPTVGAIIYRYSRWGISRYPTLEANWELILGLIVLVVVLFAKGGVARLMKVGYRKLQEQRNGDSEPATDQAS